MDSVAACSTLDTYRSVERRGSWVSSNTSCPDLDRLSHHKERSSRASSPSFPVVDKEDEEIDSIVKEYMSVTSDRRSRPLVRSPCSAPVHSHVLQAHFI